MARLYADENFPAPTVEALRRLGHDVLTAREAGQAGIRIADVDVLAFAHSLFRAVLTHNRKDFRNLHMAGHSHCGVILCTEDPDFAALAARVDSAITAEIDLPGRLIRVIRPSA